METSRQYKPFIILSMPRTGSNYLAYLLNDHPQIINMGEMYDNKTIWGQPGKAYLNHSVFLKSFRDTFPVVFLRFFIFHSYPSNIRAVGFRFFYSQMQQFSSVFNFLLERKEIKIIHLMRKNLLENLISFKLAAATNVWSSLKGTQPSIQIELDYNECLNFFIETEKTRKKYKKIFVDFQLINVYYEDLTLSPQKTLKKLVHFLNVEYCPLTCPLEKQNTRNPKEVIKNFATLKKQFEGTKWESFFKNI